MARDMFQSGDLIAYGSNGVCKVKQIVLRSPPTGGGEKPNYVLEPLYRDCVIITPTDNPKVAMRSVLTREEAEQLIDTITSIQAEPLRERSLARLSQQYKAKLSSYCCDDLMELTMSVYAKKKAAESQNHRLGVVDERFLRLAEDLLFGELAVALDIPLERVQGYIRARLEGREEGQ